MVELGRAEIITKVIILASHMDLTRHWNFLNFLHIFTCIDAKII